MSQRKTALVIVATKDLLLSVERRSSAISNCCPSLIGDEEDEASKLRRVVEAQQEVDASVKLFREATSERFNAYSAAEVILVAHLWSSIWVNDNLTHIDSNDLDRLAGRNNPEAIASLITSLLEGTSPVFSFSSLIWTNHNRGGGYYSIGISNPNRLHRLVLGDIKIV